MSHNDPEKVRISRKITYQVGWKKGTIQFGTRVETQVETASHSRLTVEDIIWRRLPFIPQSAIGYLIWLLPALSLGITILLIYALLTYTTS